MSGLVGYDSSSSDESEPDHKQPQNIGNIINDSQNTHTTLEKSRSNGESGSEQHSHVLDSGQQVGPLMGPTLPPQNRSTYNDPGSPNDSPTTYSERDTIRYLTQASHPMTSLPPSPPGSPNPALEAKFKKFLDLKAQGIHFNEDLGRKSTFRNPSLLPTLIDRAGLKGDDQYRTSIPTSVWDPLALPPYAYKEELLRTQQSMRAQDLATKKTMSAAGKRKIDFTSAGT